MARWSMIPFTGLVACFLALAPPPSRAQKDSSSGKAGTPDGAQIMESVEDRDDGRDQISTVSLEIQPKQGAKRLRRFVLLRKEFDKLTKLVTFFLAPTDVRDSAFLVWDNRAGVDQRWLYLPAIGQVRRLSVDDERRSFFGSDYVYEDMTNRDPELDNHKLVGTQKVDSWDCWVVESTPKKGRGLEFARYRSWVWKEGLLPVRQEYYDASGKVIRRGQAHDLQKIQGIWTWHRTSMTNLVTGSRSRIEIGEVKYNAGVPDQRFAENQLSRGAPKE
jgi:outer membrane lipoprotein-sorting protein